MVLWSLINCFYAIVIVSQAAFWPFFELSNGFVGSFANAIFLICVRLNYYGVIAKSSKYKFSWKKPQLVKFSTSTTTGLHFLDPFSFLHILLSLVPTYPDTHYSTPLSFPGTFCPMAQVMR